MNARQQLFIEAYLASPNATEAALRAGYSQKTAYSQGQRLLKNAEIAQKLKGRVEEAIITADEVLNGVKSIAVSGRRDSDKLKAFELLGKYLVLWTDASKSDNKTTIIVEKRGSNPSPTG